jgi:hypothetical protein
MRRTGIAWVALPPAAAKVAVLQQVARRRLPRSTLLTLRVVGPLFLHRSEGNADSLFAKTTFRVGSGTRSPLGKVRILHQMAEEKRQKIEEQNVNSMDWFSQIFRRLRECEKKPAVSWEGTYDPEREYAVGNMLTHEGSIFACLIPSKGITPVQLRTISSLRSSADVMDVMGRTRNEANSLS